MSITVRLFPLITYNHAINFSCRNTMLAVALVMSVRAKTHWQHVNQKSAFCDEFMLVNVMILFVLLHMLRECVTGHTQQKRSQGKSICLHHCRKMTKMNRTHSTDYSQTRMYTFHICVEQGDWMKITRSDTISRIYMSHDTCDPQCHLLKCSIHKTISLIDWSVSYHAALHNIRCILIV